MCIFTIFDYIVHGHKIFDKDFLIGMYLNFICTFKIAIIHSKDD